MNRIRIALIFTITLLIVIAIIQLSSFKTILKFEIKNYLQDKPEFSTITDVRARKTAFFEYLTPEIEKINDGIIALRELIIADKITDKKRTELITKYRLKEDASKEDMLEAIDILPPSIILAQSANESDWGRSRFASKYNNYFGIWCFSKGCGLVPKDRKKGGRHEIAVFDSLRDSIAYYTLNLNRNQAYKELRAIRKKMRDSNSNVDALELTKGLINYSEKRDDYVKSINTIIKYNNLKRYDL